MSLKTKLWGIHLTGPTLDGPPRSVRPRTFQARRASTLGRWYGSYFAGAPAGDEIDSDRRVADSQLEQSEHELVEGSLDPLCRLRQSLMLASTSAGIRSRRPDYFDSDLRRPSSRNGPPASPMISSTWTVPVSNSRPGRTNTERLMEGATKVRTSEFGASIIENF